MRRLSIYLPHCLIIVATLFFTGVHAQQTFKTTSNTVIGYLEYLPKGYKDNNNKYPVVIFLHGMGEKGPNSTNFSKLEEGVPKLTKLGPPKMVRQGHDFPFILISPQLKSSYGDWPSWYVMEVVEHVKKTLRIDESRIYLTGLSLGGGGVWTAAQDYPHVFAAIAPVCGSRNSTGKACNLAKEKMGVWAFHGDKDTVVPLGRSVNMINAINACGANPKAKMSIYKDVKHNAWDKAYSLTHHSPNVYTWMLSHKKGDTQSRVENKAPVVNAGKDRTITLPQNSVVLEGTASDSDGKIASYQWVKVSGGNASLANATTSTLTASNLQQGNYVFRLTVKDNGGASSSAQVKVTVVEAAATNKLPVAKAGGNKSITLPVNKVELKGSGSDSDGKITAYLWTKVSGGDASLSGNTKATLTASNLKEGKYVFRLTVKDDKNGEHSDDAVVTVSKASAKNSAPVADAGKDIVITLPTTAVTVYGKGSDKDGKIVSYEWKKRSGSALTMSNTKAPDLKLSGLKEGTYIFRLTVKDDKGATGFDDMLVKVLPAAKKDESTPSVLTVSAGRDLSITLPVNGITLQGSASSSNGKITSYQWTKVSGKKVTLTNANTASLKTSDMEQGTYVFRLSVKDDKGTAKHAEAKVIVNAKGTATKQAMPKADAGPDQTVVLPVDAITLIGNGHTSGKIVQYQWTQVAGTKVKLEDSNKANVRITGVKAAGSRTFKLLVKDNNGYTNVDHVRITFVDGATARAKSVEDVELFSADEMLLPEEDDADIAALDEQKVDLLDIAALKDCVVIVYNDRGQRIFSGAWDEDSYTSVFSREGFYLYNVMKGSRRIDSGKLYIK